MPSVVRQKSGKGQGKDLKALYTNYLFNAQIRKYILMLVTEMQAYFSLT